MCQPGTNQIQHPDRRKRATANSAESKQLPCEIGIAVGCHRTTRHAAPGRICRVVPASRHSCRDFGLARHLRSSDAMTSTIHSPSLRQATVPRTAASPSPASQSTANGDPFAAVLDTVHSATPDVQGAPPAKTPDPTASSPQSAAQPAPESVTPSTGTGDSAKVRPKQAASASGSSVSGAGEPPDIAPGGVQAPALPPATEVALVAAAQTTVPPATVTAISSVAAATPDTNATATSVDPAQTVQPATVPSTADLASSGAAAEAGAVMPVAVGGTAAAASALPGNLAATALATPQAVAAAATQDARTAGTTPASTAPVLGTARRATTILQLAAKAGTGATNPIALPAEPGQMPHAGGPPRQSSTISAATFAPVAGPSAASAQAPGLAALPMLAQTILDSTVQGSLVAAIPSAVGAAANSDPSPSLAAQPNTAATPLAQGTSAAVSPEAAPAPAATGSAPPIRQVAAALVHLTQAASGSSVTLRLDPGELGRVQVRIDRGADGSSTVHIAAEHPDTLRLLIADQAALHRTLDQAGLAQDGRSVNFSLSTPDAGSSASSDRGSSGGFMGNGNPGGGQQGGAWRQDRSSYPDPAPSSTPSTAWLRAGVDITA